MFLANTNIYGQDDGRCDLCLQQFSMNMDELGYQYFYATAWECTPIFGSENEAGLSDIYGYATEGATGVGTIFAGLDMMSNYNDCLQGLQQNYYRGIDALTTSLETCFRQMQCYLAGWGNY